MERSWYWRLTLVAGLVALAIYYALPSALYFMADPQVRRSRTAVAELIPDWLPKSRFNLGIDLQGGLHLVMGVDTEKAVQDRADRLADEISDGMREKGKPLASARRVGEAPELAIELGSPAHWAELKPILEERRDGWEVKSHSGTSVVYSMRDEYERILRDDAVEQALRTLRNRIDVLGVTEPEVRRRGESSILIQIAGLTAEDYEHLKDEIIGKTAQLEFKVVDDQSQFFAEIANAPDKPASVQLDYDTFQGVGDALVTRPFLRGTNRDELRAFLKQHPPPAERVVAFQEYRESSAAPMQYHTWLLERRTPLTGDSLTDAYVNFDQEQNQYVVGMRFDRKGAAIFEKLTRENTKRKMAIVLDDTVDSAPIIQGPIPNGSAQITLGGFKSQEEILADAKALSVVLKAGALPAPVHPQEERTVGATLGDDAVAKGKLVVLAALIGIFGLMVVYYRLSGAIGTVAMAVNMLLLFATLGAFNATLTLPGIAGLALTIGMAVDANIIQFERIREELDHGKPPRAAVDAGFDKAFSAIFDANVTTFIAAIVLFQYGSGPIRGFSTTLMIGVVINTFTAVVVPRLILDWVTRRRRLQTLSI